MSNPYYGYHCKTVWNSDKSGSGYIQIDTPDKERFCLVPFADVKGQEIAMGDAEAIMDLRRRIDRDRP